MTTKINYSITIAHLPSPQYWYHFITREREREMDGRSWGLWRVAGTLEDLCSWPCSYVKLENKQKQFNKKKGRLKDDKFHMFNSTNIFFFFEKYSTVKNKSMACLGSVVWSGPITILQPILGLQASLPSSASERGENLVWKPNHTQRSEFSRWGSSSSRLHQAIIQS